VADRVGIGTRSPLSNLHIYGETPSTMAELRLDHMATTQFGLLTSWIFRSSFGRRDILGNSPNPYITIDDVGRVGIGTGDWAPPSPLVSKLTIGPTGPGIGAQVRFMPADTTAPYFYFDNLNGAMRFVTEDINTGSENTRLIVLNDGKVGIGNLTSSSIVGRLHVRAVDDADKILYVDDVTGNRLLFIYKDFVGINIAPASPPAGQFEVNLNATFLQNVRMTDDLVVNGTFNPTANRTGQGPWIPPLMLQPANPPISMCPSDTFVCGIEAIYNANSTSVQNIRAVCCN
jgi:hypothetical protein